MLGLRRDRPAESGDWVEFEFRDGEGKESNLRIEGLKIDDSRQTSFSAAGSQDSYDSTDVFSTREDSSPSSTNKSINGHSSRDRSSNSRGVNEELLVEAKMWERNARKLMLDLETLRKESSQNQTDLETKLKRSQESNIELVSLLQDMESSWQDKMEENTELATQLQQHQLDSADLVSEIEALREKVQELERDCNELTDENLELLFKLKELHNKPAGPCPQVHSSKRGLESSPLFELKQELESMQRRSSAVEEECENLKRSNLALQATADKLVEECTSLHRSNRELGLVLNENFVKFEAKLGAILEENEKRGRLVAEEGLFAEIEAYLQQVESRLKQVEDELNVIRTETDEVVEGIRAERDDLKVENNSLVEKVSTLERAVCEFEDCKRSKAALENKLLEINRANGQLHKRIQQLEKEKDELKAMKGHGATKIDAKVSPAREDTKFFTKRETVKSPNRPLDGRRKLSLKNDPAHEPLRNQLKPSNIQHRKEGSNGSCVHDQHPQPVDSDSFSKIQWLENELAKAVEANKTYKAQLNRLKSGSQIPRYGDVVAKQTFERTKSALETELKDIRERYLHMSLRYAEVEAQREELVMKLKAMRNNKKRFSYQ